MSTPLNNGFLSGRNRYNFSSIIPEGALEKRTRIMKIADLFEIDVRTAALPFAAAPPIVSAIVPGARGPGRVDANAQSIVVGVPMEFWQRLRKEKLIAKNAPLPS